jgi:hypothetical protein
MNGTRSTPLFLAAVLTLMIFSSVRADEFSDNFAANLDQKTLDALAADIGALVGGPSFHQGKALGFPLGIDLGVHAAFVGVDSDDKILRDNGSTAHSGWVQAEYGLPGRINLIGRVGQLYQADLYGGGLRWGIFSSVVPGIPSVSISGLYAKAKHDLFSAETYSGNLVASFDIPFIHPYIGAGYDSTKLNPDGSALNGKGGGARLEAGLNLSIIPFTYLSVGGGVANRRKLGHAGLGVKF